MQTGAHTWTKKWVQGFYHQEFKELIRRTYVNPEKINFKYSLRTTGCLVIRQPTALPTPGRRDVNKKKRTMTGLKKSIKTSNQNAVCQYFSTSFSLFWESNGVVCFMQFSIFQTFKVIGQETNKHTCARFWPEADEISINLNVFYTKITFLNGWL